MHTHFQSEKSGCLNLGGFVYTSVPHFPHKHNKIVTFITTTNDKKSSLVIMKYRLSVFALSTAIVGQSCFAFRAAPTFRDHCLHSDPSHQESLVLKSTANDNSVSFRRDQQRQEWIDRSLQYYSKVMREERRRQLGQVQDYDTEEYQEEFLVLAKKHYFAWKKIKDGKFQHAESIYRRIIDELAEDDDQCDHAKLAVTTLLLALHLQRMGDRKQTRATFLNFFRIVVTEREKGHKCVCSAKVLQAFALFEMRQGNTLKSLQLAHKAIELDQSLEPVLNWKQFRDAQQRRHTWKMQQLSG